MWRPLNACATPPRIRSWPKLPDVDHSTVYRALDVLVEVGLITHTHIGHGPPVYHAVDPTPLHLVCQRCGRQSSADMALADDLLAALERDHGPAPTWRTWLCPDCVADCRE